MFGVILGFGSAIAFACNAIITRRGVLRTSSNYIANISILTGPVFSFIVLSMTGELAHVGQFPWKAYMFLALSGIIHFAFGRTWAYKSIQLIGANRSNVVTSLSPVASITLAVIVLGETVNLLMLCGIICSLSSPFITLCNERTVACAPVPGSAYGKEVDRRTLSLGMLYGAGAALFWGSSFIFIKLGLASGGTPIAGSMIAYTAASIAIIPSLVKPENKKEMLSADRKSLKIALLVGLTTNIAQLLRYLALQYGSVILVTAAIRTTPLGILLLSFIFNRQHESFSKWVLLSNALLIVGTIMILYA
ncbi:MAG: DMT family transporter [Deltaproteobacteria bacterium]|nr:DMT family transporter [Deltaproteobacteria bacterium]